MNEVGDAGRFIVSAARAASPNLPSDSVLEFVQRKKTWYSWLPLLRNDINGERRLLVAAVLLNDLSANDGPLIRYILEQEIQNTHQFGDERFLPTLMACSDSVMFMMPSSFGGPSKVVLMLRFRLMCRRCAVQA